MTPDRFRALCLDLPEAVEGSHHGHADFRLGGRVFASLHPDGRQAMVRLPPAQQRERIAAAPAIWAPASGAWGKAGCTMVQLAAVEVAALRAALLEAWTAARTVPPPRPRAPRRRAADR